MELSLRCTHLQLKPGYVSINYLFFFIIVGNLMIRYKIRGCAASVEVLVMWFCLAKYSAANRSTGRLCIY